MVTRLERIGKAMAWAEKRPVGGWAYDVINRELGRGPSFLPAFVILATGDGGHDYGERCYWEALRRLWQNRYFYELTKPHKPPVKLYRLAEK